MTFRASKAIQENTLDSLTIQPDIIAGYYTGIRQWKTASCAVGEDSAKGVWDEGGGAFFFFFTFKHCYSQGATEITPMELLENFFIFSKHFEIQTQ